MSQLELPLKKEFGFCKKGGQDELSEEGYHQEEGEQEERYHREEDELPEEGENKDVEKLSSILPELDPYLQQRLKTIEKEISLYQTHELWKHIYDEERLPVIMKYLDRLKQYTLWPNFYNSMLEIIVVYRSFLRNHNYVVGNIIFTIEAELEKMSPTFDEDRMKKIFKLVSSADNFEKLSGTLMSSLTRHQLEDRVSEPQNIQAITDKLAALDLTIATLMEKLI